MRMSEPLRIVLELRNAQAEEIARRAAVVARLDLRPPLPSPYLTIPEAGAYLRCKRQRVDDASVPASPAPFEAEGETIRGSAKERSS
jgi:hypothetical protein